MIYESNGVPIHYEVSGEGEPIILVHGFASNLKRTWATTGWIDTLRPVRKMVALDCRGHGRSGKPHDPESYGGHEMEDDIVRLMNHLGIQKADLFGYSMGAAISLRAVDRHRQRFRSLVLGGMGIAEARRTGGRPGVAQALLAKDPSTITNPVAKGFRVFAERNKNDLEALAAYHQAQRAPIDNAALAGISIPVLVVIGEGDALAGSPKELVDAIPGAELVVIPGRDHLSVVSDARFKEAVVAFLAESLVN